MDREIQLLIVERWGKVRLGTYMGERGTRLVLSSYIDKVSTELL